MCYGFLENLSFSVTKKSLKHTLSLLQNILISRNFIASKCCLINMLHLSQKYNKISYIKLLPTVQQKLLNKEFSILFNHMIRLLLLRHIVHSIKIIHLPPLRTARHCCFGHSLSITLLYETHTRVFYFDYVHHTLFSA